MWGISYVRETFEYYFGPVIGAAGAYGLRQLNQQESQGRRAMADLVTRRDALDRESEYANQQREEERRRQFLQSLFQRGAY